MVSDVEQPAAAAAISLPTIFWAFSRVALAAIGGGVTAWFLREFVEKRRWLSEQEFLTGLALSQAFPGVNVVNMSIWIGYRMGGGLGALAAALGSIVLPAMLAIVTLSLFDQLAHYPTVTAIISGVAAAAVGMTLSVGVKALRNAATRMVPVVIIVTMIVTLFLLRWPLIPVLLVLVPVSIANAFWRLRGEAARP